MPQTYKFPIDKEIVTFLRNNKTGYQRSITEKDVIAVVTHFLSKEVPEAFEAGRTWMNSHPGEKNRPPNKMEYLQSRGLIPLKQF